MWVYSEGGFEMWVYSEGGFVMWVQSEGESMMLGSVQKNGHRE